MDIPTPIKKLFNLDKVDESKEPAALLAVEEAGKIKRSQRESLETGEKAPVTPEKGTKEKEALKEAKESGRASEGIKKIEKSRLAGPTTTVTPVERVKSQTLEAIEDILAEDLKETYNALPRDLKEKFKRQGEIMASRIEILLGKVKVKTKDILMLIKNWLKFIPGVNKFFLEQEAKIKTDKIMGLKKK